MTKTTLTAATLALLLTGPALADDDDRRQGRDRDDRYEHRDERRNDDWHDRVRRYDDHRHDKRYDDKKRYDHRRDDRHRRHVPPSRYRADYGYRSGYDLAWRDWVRYGQKNRNWRRSSWHGGGQGYRSGYEAGWYDAARYYSRGYRPRYWSRDPHGSWYFGFNITG